MPKQDQKNEFSIHQHGLGSVCGFLWSLGSSNVSLWQEGSKGCTGVELTQTSPGQKYHPSPSPGYINTAGI